MKTKWHFEHLLELLGAQSTVIEFIHFFKKLEINECKKSAILYRVNVEG